VIRSPDEALEGIVDGAVIGVGGSITAGHPMALVRQVIRRGLRDLTLVAPTAGLDVDLLISAGCARTVVTSYVGAEGLAPIGPSFRAAVESGAIEVDELDEAHCAMGLRAAAQRLPFLPWRGGVGTSLPKLNPRLKEVTDPFRGEPLLAVPALKLDVALVYAEIADPHGNVQHVGTSHMDPLLAGASDLVVAQVERIVSNERIRREPARTRFWPWTLVVEAPWGTHPYSGTSIVADEGHLGVYVAAAEAAARGERKGLEEYVRRYVHTPQTHLDYLEQVGIRRIASLLIRG